MYERNAIVLERYFEKIFSFTKEDNLKTNFENYKKIIETINEYKKTADEEETAILKFSISLITFLGVSCTIFTILSFKPDGAYLS